MMMNDLAYLEISQRVEVLNQRTAVISDLLDMLKEHLTSLHGEEKREILFMFMFISVFMFIFMFMFISVFMFIFMFILGEFLEWIIIFLILIEVAMGIVEIYLLMNSSHV